MTARVDALLTDRSPLGASLRAAVQRLDKDEVRENGERSLSLWRGLLSGRWSIIRHFERDGRRFLLARRNDPEASGSSPLTTLERQIAGYAALGHSSKLIAYELGLAPSTVAERLQLAISKLGVRSRSELIQLFASWSSTP
jgi:DNA-binding NarL/FixJ family response regulator